MSNFFAAPWTIANQALLSMAFLRKEYWNGLPFPSPGDLPDSGMELMSPAWAGGFFTTEPCGKPRYLLKPPKITGFHLALKSHCYRNWGLAACHSKFTKETRLVERKVCFILNDSNHSKGEGGIPVQRPALPTDNQWARAFLGKGRRLHTVSSDRHLHIGHWWSDQQHLDCCESGSVNCSVLFNSLLSHGLPILLCPWNSPGKNTGVGCHSFLQGIFPTQGSSPGLLHCQADSLPSEPPGKLPDCCK